MSGINVLSIACFHIYKEVLTAYWQEGDIIITVFDSSN